MEVNNNKTEVHFYVYNSNITLFCFYNWDEKEKCWMWDEDKLSTEEAFNKYPPDQYQWVFFDESNDEE